MNNQLEQYKIEIPKIDLPDFYIPEIEISNFSSDNATILKITNTQDTNIIDPSDGLSLGEAIEIAQSDRENNYVIEIPGGSTYTATLEEDLSRPIIFRTTGDGITQVTITSGESVHQLTLGNESVVALGNSSVNNNFELYVDDEPELLWQEAVTNTVLFSGGVSGKNNFQSSSNHETSSLANPSDPLFSLQWHLLNPRTTGIGGINALDVWQDYTVHE